MGGILDSIICQMALKGGGGGGPSKQEIKKQNKAIEDERKAGDKALKDSEKRLAQQNATFNAQMAAMSAQLARPPKVIAPPTSGDAMNPPTRDLRSVGEASDEERARAARRKGYGKSILAGATGAKKGTILSRGIPGAKPTLG